MFFSIYGQENFPAWKRVSLYWHMKSWKKWKKRVLVISKHVFLPEKLVWNNRKHDFSSFLGFLEKNTILVFSYLPVNCEFLGVAEIFFWFQEKFFFVYIKFLLLPRIFTNFIKGPPLISDLWSERSRVAIAPKGWVQPRGRPLRPECDSTSTSGRIFIKNIFKTSKCNLRGMF